MTTSDLTPARQVKVFKQTFISFPATRGEIVRLAAWNLVLEHNQEAVLQHESSMKVKDVRRFWPRPRKPLAAWWGWKKNQGFFSGWKGWWSPGKLTWFTWENHPIEKEKHLNQTFMTLGSMLNFGGIWWMKMLCKPWLFVGFVLVLIQYVLIIFEQKGLSVPFGGGTRESWHLSFILGLSKRLSSENLMAIARLANARDAWLIFI